MQTVWKKINHNLMKSLFICIAVVKINDPIRLLMVIKIQNPDRTKI